jgi:hypothetical protein
VLARDGVKTLIRAVVVETSVAAIEVGTSSEEHTDINAPS